jgi:hypothetical protein
MKRDLVSFVASFVRATACHPPLRRGGFPGLIPCPFAGRIFIPLRPTKGAVARRRAAGRGGGVHGRGRRGLGTMEVPCVGRAETGRHGSSAGLSTDAWTPREPRAGRSGRPLALLDFVSTSTSARSRRLRRPHRPAHPLRNTLAAKAGGVLVLVSAGPALRRRHSGAGRRPEPGTHERSVRRASLRWRGHSAGPVVMGSGLAPLGRPGKTVGQSAPPSKTRRRPRSLVVLA